MKRPASFWSGEALLNLTWFHGERETGATQEKRDFESLMEKESLLLKLLTSCQASKKELISSGFPEKKIIVVPIGVNTKRFLPPLPGEREQMRRELGIPENAFCIGSFQKDGEGLEDGMIPKPVKSPETFLKSIKLAKEKIPNLFVFLTGPARGFVKKGLDEMGVPYVHHFLKNYLDITKCYHALDAYVIGSRCEGGPLGFMESWCTGVPVVSTRMGMPADYIRDGIDGGLVSVGDSEGIASKLVEWNQNPDLTKSIALEGRKQVDQLDWEVVAEQYWKLLYEPQLKELV